MKKWFRSLLAVLICLCIISGSGSFAYAEEGQQEETQEQTEDSGETEKIEEGSSEPEDETGNGRTPADETETPDAGQTADGMVTSMDGVRETDELYGMDENGNLHLMPEDENAAFPVEETARENAGARAADVKIVNFRANSAGQSISSSVTTEFTEYQTGMAGYTCGAYGADAAYLGTENGKVKFMLSGVVGLVDSSKVQVVNLSSAKSYSQYYTDGTAFYHRVSTNMTTTGWGSTIYVGMRPSYISAGTVYYSYDGHYFYTNYATMIGDYQANTRKNAVNAGNPYYNYYQFLPSRSATSYSGDGLSSLINQRTNSGSKMYNSGSIFVSNQNTYGTNALLMAGVAANESAWGTSSYAMNRNNLFGIGAVDANPDNATMFSSVSQCIKDYSETYLSKRYLRAGYTYYHGGFLGDKASGMNVSWASDPYWGEKAAGIAWNLDKLGGYQDREKYTIGIKDTINTAHNVVNVRKEASTSSTALYHTGTMSNYAVLIRGTSGGFYEIQSDPVLNSGRTGINTNTGNYNRDQMYAYISQDYVTVVSGGDHLIDTSSEGVTYSVHAQSYGWMSDRMDGQQAGTVGEAKRLEAFRLQLRNQSEEGGIQYQAYCQTYGWLDWVQDGAVAGTTGEAKRMEAVRIKLTGKMADKYDVYYRVHSQTYGWLDWAKNGEMAGTSDFAKRMEAIEIRLVEKDGKAPGATDTPCVQSLVKYRTHVQSYDWQGWRMEGVTAGTTGAAKRLESIQIELMNQGAEGDIEYRTHVQSYGWLDWAKNGEASGTTGKAKRLEAVQIRLTGDMADKYDIYYRVHAQTYGWLDWAKNGEYAGTTGMAKRLEAIEIQLVKKGGAAPGATARSYVQPLIQYQTHVQSYGWQGFVDGGAMAGTMEEAKRVEALQIALKKQEYPGSVEYKVLTGNEGWGNYVSNGKTAGTTGQAKRLEAVRIQLTGQMEQHYDIYYRAYCQSYGWLGWAKNGESAGTEGLSKRLEAVQILLVDKDGEAPGDTDGHFISN